MTEGVIQRGIGGLYYALDAQEQLHVLRAKGKFRKLGLTPTVGDRILFTPGQGDEHGWVEEILPRRNVLVRPPVSNIERLLLVVAPQPVPDLLLMDTLLVMAYEQGIDPALVVNKCDLDEAFFDAIRREYSPLGIPVVQASARTGLGMEELRALLRSGLCAFAGQSGVGKSTLLSAATGLSLQTGAISERIHRGRHTTRQAELLYKDGVRVLDTPGFSLLSLWERLEPIQLKQYYPEFAPYEGQCRYAPCYHLREPGCAVLEAARRGELPPGRLERYHILLDRVQKAWRERYE